MSATLDGLFPGTAPVLLDGAMGSALHADGWPTERPTALANLEAPGLVSAIHAGHHDAGARLLVSNTFSALLVEGRQATQAASAGVRMARKVAGDDGVVAGGLAAFGLASPSLGEVVAAMVDGGAQLLLFETCASPRSAQQALELADRVAPRLPVVICASTTDGGHEDRDQARAVLEIVNASGHPRALAGVNCCRGPHDALRLARELDPAVRWVKPSTGLPGERVEDNVMAGFARAAVLGGARYLGGCCGTTADTLAAMGAAVDGAAP